MARRVDPLTSRERAIFWIVALLCASTRFLAKARTLWEWDEMLFCLALRDYDVAQHHPHPPGFPVYVGMAKVVRLFVDSDFHAYQTINLVAAVLVFPAVYLFAREVGLRFSTCVVAGALFAFFPNVLFFGGTAFSDVPSIVLVTFAAALLLRGRESRWSYWGGTLLLALAMGIRPQNLLVGLFPGILATRKRRWWEIAIALLIGVTILSVAFGAAIDATGGFERYFGAVRGHGDYISTVDSFRNPQRPAMWRLFDRFYIKIYQSTPLSLLISIFVIAGAVAAVRTRDRAIGRNVLTFGPFAIFAWFMLDRYSISRFSIGYAPMFALLAAYGIAVVARERRWLEPAIAFVLIAAFCVWTVPSLTPVRNEVSPPLRAIEEMQRRIDPKRHQLYAAHTMMPFIDYFAPGTPYIRVLDDRALPVSDPREPWLLAEVNRIQPNAHALVYRRERGALWKIARRHYFDVMLQPMDRRPRFEQGWYPPELGGMDEWRWMAGRSTATLPAASGEMMLRLELSIPVETLRQRPIVTVTLNGRVLERVRVSTRTFSRDYEVLANGNPSTLVLTIDRTLNPLRAGTGTDDRELGMEMRFLSWGPD